MADTDRGGTEMAYTRLGDTGLEVSKLCLGCMNFGSGQPWMVNDRDRSLEILDRAMDLGINFLDTANVYSQGESEEIVGEAIEGYDRDELVVATKVFGPMGDGPNQQGLSRKHILDQCEASLDRLGLDYVDLYQIHRWDDDTPIEETLSALDHLVETGKVRYVGASTMTSYEFTKALYTADVENYERFVCMQPEYNAVDRHEEANLLPVCEGEGVGVIPWSPLAGGFLTGKYERGEDPEEGLRADADEYTAERFTDENWAVLDAVREVAADEGATEPTWEEPIDLQFALDDTSSLPAGVHFVHQVRAEVKPGEYELVVSVPADPSAQRDRALEMRRDVMVTDYVDGREAMLSDVQLASSIAPGATEGSSFYKHGLTVRPNVNRLFGGALGQLFYFAEAYHTDEAADEYVVRTYISPHDQQEPVDDALAKRDVRASRARDVIVGSFDISDLPSDSYFLRMALLDDDGEVVVEQAKKFFVYNPEVERRALAVDAVPADTTVFTALTDEELEREVGIVRYLATDREQDRAKRVSTAEGRRQFLQDFWRKRDPQPRTAVNEAREQFLQRVAYIDERYGGQIREGWETDQGRVLIQYGDPLAIERNPVGGSSTLPYVIWEYDNIPGEGRSVFVFVDREGFGVYDLIHSSVPGERKTPGWPQIIS